jgi:hypothetical protein
LKKVFFSWTGHTVTILSNILNNVSRVFPCVTVVYHPHHTNHTYQVTVIFSSHPIFF